MRSRVDNTLRCVALRLLVLVGVELEQYMSSTATTQKSSFFDLLKPRHHEAVFRLKNSIIALIALFALTHLLPLPTPYASAWKVYQDSFQSSWEKGLAITGACSPTHPHKC